MLYTRTKDHTVLTIPIAGGGSRAAIWDSVAQTTTRTTVWPDHGTAMAYALLVAYQTEEGCGHRPGDAQPKPSELRYCKRCGQPYGHADWYETDRLSKVADPYRSDLYGAVQ